MNKDLLKTAESILDEVFYQIEFLMKNSNRIKELTGGMVDCSKICDFRTAVNMVYLTGLDQGILERVTIAHFELFLDKGFFNEFMLDQRVYMLSVVNSAI